MIKRVWPLTFNERRLLALKHHPRALLFQQAILKPRAAQSAVLPTVEAVPSRTLSPAEYQAN
jgi:hypothetical protein